MKAACEIIVSTNEVLAALSGDCFDYVGQYPAPLSVRLSACPIGLSIEASTVNAELAGRGIWSRVVEVDALLFRSIVERYEATGSLMLIYTSRRLFVNRTGIPAWERTDLSRPVNPSGPVQARLFTQRDDIRQLEARSLRGRRQRGTAALPLFRTTDPADGPVSVNPGREAKTKASAP